MVWVVPQYSFFLLPHMSKKRAVVRHFSEVAIGQICVPYLEAWNHICCLHSFIINFFYVCASFGGMQMQRKSDHGGVLSQVYFYS